MKVLITGSSGRIGRAIYVRLALEHKVVGFDKSPSSTADFVGDVADVKMMRRALHGVDAIVHTAALHAPQVGLVSDSEFKRVNIEATQLLADLAVDSGINRFIFTSTTALYGGAATPGSEAGWVDENLKPEPRTIYHVTKVEAENLLEIMASQTPLLVTVLRMSRCFPEPAPLMATYRLHRGIDARDVADAHARSLTIDGSKYRVFVISGATPFRQEDVFALKNDAPSVIVERAPKLAEGFSIRGWDLPQSIDRVYTSVCVNHELSWAPRYGCSEVLKMLDDQSSEVLPPRFKGDPGQLVTTLSD